MPPEHNLQSPAGLNIAHKENARRPPGIRVAIKIIIATGSIPSCSAAFRQCPLKRQ